MKIINTFILIIVSILLLLLSTINGDDSQLVQNKFEAKLLAPYDAKFSTYRAKLRDINNFNEVIEIPNKDGQFSFVNMPNGFYLLEIESMQYNFPNFKIDVLGKNKIKVRPAENETSILPLPLQIRAINKIPFFQQHVPFSIFSLIQNPMAISILFTCVLIFALPKMTSFIDQDEETKEAIKAQTPTLVQKLPEWPSLQLKQIEN